MPNRKEILHELDHQVADADWCDNDWKDNVPIWVLRGALALLREQEPKELTKDEWQMWKKDQRRNPICMVFEGDTTPFWVLYPEEVNELLYFMGKIKLFTNKPEEGAVKWGD